MPLKDWITLLAIILGPILALQIQKWMEVRREKRNRKLYVFRTLMTTRATRVSNEHVTALNMIDVEFVDDTKVVTAWRTYHDQLSQGYTPETLHAWADRSLELLMDLLYEMGQSLGYKFDKLMLKRIQYSPIAHGDIEADEASIRQGLARILKGDTSFPIWVANDQREPEAPVKAEPIIPKQVKR